MNLAAPVALGVIGKHVSDNNLNVGGFMSMLASQKDNILSAVPSGLGLASALGLGSLGDIGNKLSSTLSSFTGGAKQAVNTAADTAKRGTRWLLPLILILLAIAAIWYFMRGCNKTETTANTTTDTTGMTAPPPVNANSIKVQLPDGTELDAFKGGIEDRLVAFLNDANSKPGKDVWFDFDNLNFETGSAKITDESQKQVNNIAAILKAYPKVKIKIGGYTDKTGDAASNKKLSQDRAEVVVAALKKAGVNSAQLLGAEGYGSEFAKAADNASEEERKQDRRIAVSVREK